MRVHQIPSTPGMGSVDVQITITSTEISAILKAVRAYRAIPSHTGDGDMYALETSLSGLNQVLDANRNHGIEVPF